MASAAARRTSRGPEDEDRRPGGQHAIVADGATDEQARSQIWLVGRHGPLFDDIDDLRDFQEGYARKRFDSPFASRSPGGS
jgi:hypothetical protein